MRILKFGGTSVGSADRIKTLVPLIESNEPQIIVLSAMSGTTNALVEIARLLYGKNNEVATLKISVLEKIYLQVCTDLFSELSSIVKGKELIKTHFEYLRSFTLDLFTINEEKAILAQGELMSTALFHYYLEEQNISSALLPALNFMRIDKDGEPDYEFMSKALEAELLNHPQQNLFITQGYICRNVFGEIDNLKRGGSDYTATILGAVLNVEEVQIWTDIDGMHNNDPRMVDKTFPVTELSFDEAAELAYFGAKILHPACVLPAQKKNIPVKLLNTMDPKAKGTTISNRDTGERITAVAAKDGIVSIQIKSARMLLAYGFLRNVFEIFERYKTPIDMITTSEVSVSVTIDDTKNLDSILEELRSFCSVTAESNQSIICIVGNFKAEKYGIAARIFDALKDVPIRMISYGASQNNVSVLVSSDHKKSALTALNIGLFSR